MANSSPIASDRPVESANVGNASRVCSDSIRSSAGALPRLCTDPAPWVTSGTPSVRLTIDAAARGQPWNRFYERAVAADHAHTLLCTAWGRNAQSALKKAHEQAGFRYARFHGILDDDIGVYSEAADGTPIYTWTRLDQVYDAVVAAGMRPIVEIGFMPTQLASNPAKTLSLLWYDKASPNISPPKDWIRWKKFMAEIVGHIEKRYGAEEVRTNWYFEVWNEPSWMYSAGDAGYAELYTNTATGLLTGDPRLRVGGPAGSAGESPFLIPALIASARAAKVKLDFITYHRYGDDDGTRSDANGMLAFHRKMRSILTQSNFAGELINDEFGPSSKADVCRDDESAASFIAKTIHLIGTDSDFAPPTAYGYWAISDLYEEFDTGGALAYREGNYGLLLKGDPRFSESFDVAKPAFNAFRLLHRLGETRLPVAGGTTGDGVNAAATASADGQSMQILVYNHVAGARADSTASSLISLTVDNLPFAPGRFGIRHFVVDRTHANSHTAWVAMGKPQTPTREQWAKLRDAADLCYYEASANVKGHSWTVSFPQNVSSVSLIELGR
jgi:xylan 1,4-beta-xylosidase